MSRMRKMRNSMRMNRTMRKRKLMMERMDFSKNKIEIKDKSKKKATNPVKMHKNTIWLIYSMTKLGTKFTKKLELKFRHFCRSSKSSIRSTTHLSI